MATGPGYPSPTNVVIPNWEASGRLAVGFTRNPKRFNLASYAHMRQCETVVGVWKKFGSNESVRVVDQNDYAWADGQPRPQQTGGERFTNVEYTCKRNNYGFRVGYMTEKAAPWSVVEHNARIEASRLMTARTLRAVTVLNTASNWQTSGDPVGDMSVHHTGDVTTLGFGPWNQGSGANPYILNTIGYVLDKIAIDTNGIVKNGSTSDGGGEVELFCMINPTTARGIAGSLEIHDFLRGSPDARNLVLKGWAGQQYNLPPSYGGVNFLIEDAVRVSSQRGATLSKGYIVPDGVGFILARVGGLQGEKVLGTGDEFTNFSTLTVFYTDDIVVKRNDQEWHQLTEGGVHETTAEVLTCPEAGFRVTGLLG